MLSLVLLALSACDWGYAGSADDNSIASGTGTGTGYAFAGSFSGDQGNFPAFDFSGVLNDYLKSFEKFQHEYFENLKKSLPIPDGASTKTGRHPADSNFVGPFHTSGQEGSSASGYGYSGTFGRGDGLSHSEGTGDSDIRSGVTGFGFGGSFGDSGSSFGLSGSEGAVAHASIGPEGGYQFASVEPENPDVPNFESRFGGGGGSSGPGGFKFVSTSSHSGTTTVNGKPTKFNQATTTINDNGKITTHTVKNP